MTRHDTTRHDTTRQKIPVQLGGTKLRFFTEKVGQVVSLTPTFVNWVVAKKIQSENEGRKAGPAVLYYAFGTEDTRYIVSYSGLTRLIIPAPSSLLITAFF